MSDTRVAVPWTNVFGLARTLVALGTLGTLLFSSAETLFRPVATIGDYPLCEGAGSLSVFCLAPDSYTGLTWLMWACVAVLLVVASGWRPRWTCLPHLYVHYSVVTGIAIGDGGDQISLILALLFVLPSLGDPRRWHWQDPSATARPAWALVGAGSLVVVRLQMSLVYFQASVAKLPHAEWADGTAMWYWSHNPSFGAPGWLEPLVGALVSVPWGVALMTWTPLFIEISLAACLLLRPRARLWVGAAGVMFHLSIAMMMGLWSFSLAMAGGIVVLCLPAGSSVHRRKDDRSADVDAPGVSERQEAEATEDLAGTAARPRIATADATP
ncbi:sporulation-delaying protein SdpB family protein [Streptomyces sp. NPDC060198]|uniref:sporulation-delaying protein SdpB family protein n=1 Tax=Streptomyces sp. NPDC060198 TaxID=3347070 RepID=UPI003658398B